MGGGYWGVGGGGGGGVGTHIRFIGITITEYKLFKMVIFNFAN